MTSILKTDEIQSQNGGAVVKIQTLKHPSASGNNLELASDGKASFSTGISNAGTIDAGTFNGTLGSSASFSTDQIVKTTIKTYNPGAIQNLHSGNGDAQTLYFNSNLNQTVSLTSGNKLAVFINGGRVTVGTANVDGFGMNIQVNNVNYLVGGLYENDSPLNVFCVSDAISATSTTIKFGGFTRYNSATPTLDLRNSSGGAVSGSPLRYLIYELQV